MRLALYQPDIPQNAGTLLRTAACLGFAVDIIEPAGFQMTDRALRRAGLDYIDHAVWRRFASWTAFESDCHADGRRLILLTRHSDVAYTSVSFEDRDTLLVGREGSGVPDEVSSASDLRITVPMRPNRRSLNVAIAAAMVIGEVYRQARAAQEVSP